MSLQDFYQDIFAEWHGRKHTNSDQNAELYAECDRDVDLTKACKFEQPVLHVLVFREHLSSESYKEHLVSALDLPERLCRLIYLLIESRHRAAHHSAYKAALCIDCRKE